MKDNIYKELFSSLTLIYAILDLEGKIIDCNEAILQTFGYTSDEFKYVFDFDRSLPKELYLKKIQE